MKTCPTCDGKGKQTIRATELTDSGWKKLPPVDITCITCDGKKKITRAKELQLERMNNAWCRCGNPSGRTVYVEFPGYHGWDCADCGKIVQTG